MKPGASDLIAAHIAAHGVTRCPAAIVAPSSAELSRADIEAHRARPSIYAPCKFGGAWKSKAAYDAEKRR